MARTIKLFPTARQIRYVRPVATSEVLKRREEYRRFRVRWAHDTEQSALIQRGTEQIRCPSRWPRSDTNSRNEYRAAMTFKRRLPDHTHPIQLKVLHNDSK